MAKHAPIFHAAATRAGVKLTPDVKLPWLMRYGHLAPAVQARLPDWTLRSLDEIFEALEGDRAAMVVKTRGGMTADFVLDPGAIPVEYDEIQHFTTARILTLGLYPAQASLSFDPSEYQVIAERWRSKGDKGFAHKEAAEFAGRGGRQRQRAYFDAFRDLAAPCFGSGPILRIPAPANDYENAVVTLKRMIAAHCA